ncbi:MAG: VOC family protein [Acidimicrobiales bacterium]|jgi:hypothetical protein|nr:VOC family protein [Acidimicrobiales bacterium]
MPERNAYQDGVPNWVDLPTPDAEASKAFYGALFGWEFTEEPTDRGVPYVMGRKAGRAVAGMMQKAPDDPTPTFWTNYVAVDDVDVTAAKVSAAGGTVVLEPMDVMESGRMALVADPTGAFLGLWQAGNHIGAELVNEPGAITWNELTTPDVPAAAAFFAEVLGWRAETQAMATGDYTVFLVGDRAIAGAMPPPMEGIPASWTVYFAVEDCDAAVAAAQGLGAALVVPAIDAEPGRFALVADPQGAMFWVMQLAQPGD